MATNEEQVKLAAKLYKCRDAAKTLYGETYLEKMADYQKYIKGAMIKFGMDCEIKATMKMIEELGSEADGMITMLLLAACVELVEPSKEGVL